MKAADFNELVEHRIELIRSVLSSKGKEYAHGKVDDQIRSFKRYGQRRNCCPESANRNLAIKHILCIEDMVDDCEDGFLNRSVEYIEEKIGDEINYLILLEAQLKERLIEQSANNKIPFPTINDMPND